jgi:serine/threonine protein kinase
VAIKVLAENWSHDLRVRERFLDEGRLLWRLDHERLVRVHAVGDLPDGRPYLVMAWARGGSLRELLAAGPVPAQTGMAVLHEVAAAAAVLHAHGIVHRDLTPGNVLFRSPGGHGPGEVLLADLGLAKALAAASGLTARAGTPGFMAPEQDDPLAVVDARADVFGLGRLGVALLGAGADRPPVARVLRRATSPRPGDRYPDAAAFAAALRHAVDGPRALGRRLAGAGVLAAAVLATTAASGRPGPVVLRPAPVQAVALPSATLSPPASRLLNAPDGPPSPTRSPTRSPTPTPSPTPSLPSSCLGRVVVRMNIDDIFMSPGLCLSVGGMLQVGPAEVGTVKVTPDGMTTGSYEGAITSILFNTAGKVTVTVDVSEGSDAVLVVVVI